MKRVFSFSHTTILTAAASLVVALVITTPADAAPIRFDNLAGPGHFDWAPLVGETNSLNITLPASAQPGVDNGPSSFRQLNNDPLGTLEGSTGFRELQAGGSHPALVWASQLGDPIPANPLPTNHSWMTTVLSIHPALGTNLTEGEQSYIGVRFDLGSGWQHGWIGVVRTGSELDAFAWGYETEPGIPIAAGVPEPGTLSLLAIAGGALMRRRRRAK